MPRGVYDRAAAKAKKAAKAAAGPVEAPKQKRKYTKRSQQAAPEIAGVGGMMLKRGEDLYGVTTLNTILGNFCTMKSAGHNVVDPLIKKTVKILEAKLDALLPSETEGNGAVEKPITTLPTPEKFTSAPPPPAS